MAKSKLSLRQQNRIRAKQKKATEAVASDQVIETLLNSGQLGPEQKGMVVTRYSNQADVASVADPNLRRRCYFRAHLESPVSGDRVIWRDGEPYGVIYSVLPRTSLLERPDSRGFVRPVAANINHIVIVIAPEPQAHAALIDRYLVACEYHQIEPTLVVNKADMPGAMIEPLTQLANQYLKLGYRVVRTSAKTGIGVDTLGQLSANRVSIFVGQSGVGKSSLINALSPSAQVKTGELSHAKAKGRHTTTTTDLYTLANGGRIIDSPGVREFGLLHLNEADLANGFIEFRDFLGQCRFRNCSHRDDPGCALEQACQNGLISDARLKSFRDIRESLHLT